MQKLFLYLLLLFYSSFLFAQNKDVINRIAAIEKSKASVEFITELKKILATSNISNEDNMAVQTTLVHQYQALQMWDTCLNYCQAQVIIAHKQKNTLAEATFYKLIGGTYYFIPKKDKAIEYWNKSIALSEPNNFSLLLEMCYHNIGVIYLEEVKYDKAESYLENAYKIGLSNNPKTAAGNLLHTRLLATLYSLTKRFEKAENKYLETISNCELAKDTPMLAETLMFYSKILIDKKDFANALKTSGDALAYTRKLSGIEMIRTALTIHSENLFKAGKYKEANDLKEELINVVSKRYSVDLTNKIGEAEAKFKNAETIHEKKLAILNAKKEKQIYTFSFLGLLSISGFVFYYMYQKRIAKQKADIQKAQIQFVLDGEEKERTRIAKDLHDGIVQDLTGIKLQLNAGINDDAFVHKKIVIDAVESLDKASKEVRNISYQMMPATLTQLGLLPALDDLLKRVLTPSNINYDFEQIGIAKRLPDNIEVSIFRITQELLNNVLKHSQANFVSLLITIKEEVVTMIFEDNGKGFDAATIKKGIGFSSLSSRVELLHGDIKYEKADGVGTMAIVKIPVIYSTAK
ncbi:MAG: sensor histidine kinase [Ferruginibacter sp.]|nr:sensor histidine kinase [Ferruginibacter sp.]